MTAPTGRYTGALPSLRSLAVGERITITTQTKAGAFQAVTKLRWEHPNFQALIDQIGPHLFSVERLPDSPHFFHGRSPVADTVRRLNPGEHEVIPYSSLRTVAANLRNLRRAGFRVRAEWLTHSRVRLTRKEEP